MTWNAIANLKGGKGDKGDKGDKGGLDANNLVRIQAIEDKNTAQDERMDTLVVGHVQDYEPLLVSITDAEDARTWLEANDVDGGPSAHSRALIEGGVLGGATVESAPVAGVSIAMTDAEGGRTWLEANTTNGGPTDHAVRLIESRLGGAGYHQPLASDRHIHPVTGDMVPTYTNMARIAGWGSSSMKQAEGPLSVMSNGFGATYVDGGKYSEKIENITSRLGSHPALLTVSGGRIPNSGTVRVDSSNVPFGNQMLAFSGYVEDLRGKKIRGSLSWNAVGGWAVFTRESSGAVADIAPDSPFIPDLGNLHRNAVTLLWMGKNNDTESNAVSKVVSYTDEAVEWLSPVSKRVLVLGHFINTNTSAISEVRDRLNAINAAHAKRYGDQFVDVQAYLSSPKLWADTGITPTQADLNAQSLGNKPESVSADNGHLNSAGHNAVTNFLIKPAMTNLGWY